MNLKNISGNRKTDTKKFHIKSLKLILEKVIPHFDKYPCLTSKELNYKDWKKIVELKNKGLHKTVEGLALINEIVSKMNSKRD